jgi:hypothetical protein
MSKLPDYPMKGKPVEDTIREIIDYLRLTTITNFQGGKMKQSRGGTTLTIPNVIRPKIQDLPYDPFYPILKGNETDGLLLKMIEGYVILRKKSGSDAMAHILPSGIPDDLSVAIGDKFTLKIEEDTDGVFTSAAIIQTSGAWPTSTAPDLDAASASGGVRHIRLCEVIKETDFPEVVIWSTGHVDHFAPTIIETAEASGATLIKGYTDGKWLLKQLVQGEGITLTENADGIEISATDESTGWWGVLSWLFYSGSFSTSMAVSVEAGRIISVSLDGVDQPGTQETPGGVELEVELN